MAQSVTIVPLEPYGKTGVLVPIVLARMQEMAEQHVTEMDPRSLVRSYATRLYSGDPGVKIVAFVDEKMRVVGHAVASLETDGAKKWLFIQQVKADEDVGDAVGRALGMAEEWARSEGCQTLLMATHRDDAAFRKKYGFEKRRSIMAKSLVDEPTKES